MPRLRFVSTVEGADTIELQEPVITIGRGINNVVCIEDANISKNHVLLIREDDTYRIFDLHSVNGTIINGKRISVATLHAGDAVRIGYLDLTYEIAAPVLAKPVVAESSAPPVNVAPAPVTLATPVLAVPPHPVSTTPTPAPTSPPAPAPTTLITPAPELAKLAQPTEPVEPAATAPPAEEAAETPPAGHKKFGAPPGGQNLKFRLKRE